MIFIDVTHTAITPAQTGIQRVVRQLWRELRAMGKGQAVEWKGGGSRQYFPVRPTRYLGLRIGPPRRRLWGHALIRNLVLEQARFFERKTGGLRKRLHRHPQFGARLSSSWLLMGELPPAEDVRAYLQYAHAHGMRAAAIFHDPIAVLKPEWVDEAFSRNHFEYMKALSDYDLVIADSEFSRVHFSRLLDERGIRVPPTRTCLLASPAEQPLAQPKDTQAGVVRFLCVCTLEPRKNHLGLLQTLDWLERRYPSLPWECHLAGASYAGRPEIAGAVEAAAARNPRLIWHGSVDDSTLRNLYRTSHFTVYPSLMEGFGLPILESIALGRPCLCAGFGAMAEVAEGGGCLTVDVSRPEILGEGIHRLLTEPVLLDHLRQEAVRRPKRTWKAYAEEVVHHLHEFDSLNPR